MAIFRWCVLVAFLFIISSCADSSAENKALRKELELKDKELELQKRELLAKQMQDSLNGSANKSLADQYEEVKDAVYLLYTTDNEDTSQGSAFVINEAGVAISNYHVFEDASDAIAVNARGEKFIIDEIYAYSRTNDYIIFKLAKPGIQKFKFVKIAGNLPRIGENCFAIGNPYGLVQTISTGIVSSYREDNHYIQTTAEITHGSSGGPLFNNAGEVIGITTSGMGEADLNFAININILSLNQYFSDKYTVVGTDNVSDYQAIKIKDAIANYYAVYESQDYTKLKSLFASDIKRFHSLFNTDPETAIENARKYDKAKGIKIVRADIDWNKFQVIRIDDHFQVNFPLDYEITRKEMNKPTHFQINMTFELDNSYKIVTIYENILSKS